MFAAVRAQYGVERDDTLQLRDFPTINHVAAWIRAKAQLAQRLRAALPEGSGEGDAVVQTVVRIVADLTGYPPDLLDPDLDLEADLGVDTVKQAEVFAAVRAQYGVERDDTLAAARLPHHQPRRRLDPRQGRDRRPTN